MITSKTIYQVDAFATEPFKGNPAGVCILENEPPVVWMQNVAMEMNLSETAFIFMEKGFRMIRFFTPETEIDLCGHATLASAHVMYETGITKPDEEITFTSKAGTLKIRKEGSWITMNFPAYNLDPIPVPEGIEKIIGVVPVELYKTGHGWILALLKNEDDVREMKPLLQAMKNSAYGDLIITAPSSDLNYDFCVRCFAPALGIDEDPVTGSAHCSLVPFWNMKMGKHDFVSHQVSKRGGILKVSLKGNSVDISGQAKTIFRAELFA